MRVTMARQNKQVGEIGEPEPGGGRFIPRRAFFTRGVGRHKEELRSFELALRDAGIEKLNLVHVSSIIPPGCKIVPRAEGLRALEPGQIVFCVFSRCVSNEPHRLIAASVGCAIPADRTAYGYLSEYTSFGKKEQQAGDHAEDLAASMLASTLGIEFDDELVWDAKKEIWKISGKIVRTMNITQSAVVDNKGYTTVVAAAVFLP
ncbi:putative pyruvoyl-dependent arginine decarboxylase, pdaD [Candidatus Bipolaricaulis anaerobius]|uniref:Pyruvoyl-dependent arginine decarboxylase AaxB n=2 Tax=Candidatus Bipolaricaulis anaerobius TaxID=2026885 RepID=A0A2X3MK41_9BACT|nr:putative pyruvoyl-dependent arginine decarboxylase, pdaD [Candidatus Bipolaricaulis anaerobius]